MRDVRSDVIRGRPAREGYNRVLSLMISLRGNRIQTRGEEVLPLRMGLIWESLVGTYMLTLSFLHIYLRHLDTHHFVSPHAHAQAPTFIHSQKHIFCSNHQPCREKHPSANCSILLLPTSFMPPHQDLIWAKCRACDPAAECDGISVTQHSSSGELNAHHLFIFTIFAFSQISPYPTEP